jgi:5-methyltetrahydropteroyltriglutamate--homocysteine methyltransferase
VEESIQAVVRRQAELGMAVLNDGEHSKSSFVAYPFTRLGGFEAAEAVTGHRGPTRDSLAFPAVYEEQRAMYAARPSKKGRPASRPSLVCTAPITYIGQRDVQADVDNLRNAMQDVSAEEGFMTALSPNNLALNYRNEYYRTPEEYLFALADAMKPEYDAIASAGLTLQVDCPDLAMTRMMGDNVDLTDEQYLEQGRLHVRAINHALRDVPPEQSRLHLCWGNGAWPHIYDIPMRKVVDVALAARPAGLSFEMANPAHAHEWQIWEDVKLPEGKVLIPGVLDSCTNYVEHPELVAQRLVALAKLVGRENVIAGTDCGFGSFAGLYSVDPPVTWLKFRAMSEGARIASERLW